jgi:hypothetical protein
MATEFTITVPSDDVAVVAGFAIRLGQAISDFTSDEVAEDIDDIAVLIGEVEED